MNPFDDLIARATAKLGMDGELRLEIGRELRGHLEDSAAEYEAGGYSSERAVEEAVKRLGDPGELAEELWRANRGRLRVRAVVKWAAQILLVPAAVVVAVWALAYPWYAFIQLRYASSTGGMAVWPVMVAIDQSVPNWIGAVVRSAVGDPTARFTARDLARLSEEQRWVLLGDPKAENDLEKARSIVERWPDNPVYYGNFVNWSIVAYNRTVGEVSDAESITLPQYLDVLDRGERLEPDNGLYNLLRAAVLARQAGELAKQDAPADCAPTTEPSFTPQAFERLDPATMERVLAELHRGVHKPRLTSHAMDLLRERLEMLSTPRNLVEYLQRVNCGLGMLLPDLSEIRRVRVTACAYAWALAQQGRTDRAQQILQDVSMLASLMSQQSDGVLIKLLVGQKAAQEAAQYQTAVARLIGGADQITAAEAQEKEVFARRRGFGADNSDYIRRAGVSVGLMAANIPRFEPDPSPVRGAEQAVFEQVSFGVMLLAASGVLAVAAVLAWLLALRGRAGRGGVMIFVGWARLGRIALWSVVVPAAVYVLYAMLPIANRQFGVNYMFERFLVEKMVLFLAICLLLWQQSQRAMADRAAELGLPVAPEGWSRRAVWAALALLVMIFGAYVGAWQVESLRPWEIVPSPGGEWPAFVGTGLTSAGWWLAGALGAVMAVWALWLLGRAAMMVVRGRMTGATSLWSLLPILASVVIVLGLGERVVLRQVEARSLSSIRGLEDMTVFREIDESAFRELRDWHARRLQELRAGATTGQSDVPLGGAGG
ncbi:MAG: hypothetical protein IT442_05240 [Phycisphaeraceae bacterium]|nr:hypothetical protein [Phycisphaeraceae bacterium]